HITIRRIVDKSGKVLQDQSVPEDPFLASDDRLDRLAATAGVEAERVIDPTTAYLIGRVLRDGATRGIAWAASRAGVPAAGKTGTSSKTMDTWFVGYSES